MKNNLILFFLLFFFTFKFSLAEKYDFEVSNITLSNDEKLINASEGKISTKNNDLTITAKEFKYFKNLELLKAFNGKAFLKTNNLKINFKEIEIDDKKLIITASGGIIINDLENSLDIKSETIILDRKNNVLSSNTDTIINDKLNNIVKTKNFEYQLSKNTLKISKVNIVDFDNNIFEIDLAYIDTKTFKLIGKDISINLNNTFLNPDNEPRLKGKSVKHTKNKTEISKGVFTACKKTDKCPPWQLSAEKIVHNKKKKNINYENVLLKIYDVPVVYFPKFFHPDPTVKRQSGFLMPTFKNSPNKNTFLSIPYYKVLSDNKDLTFTPRFYAKDQLLLQNEYRQVNKNSSIKTDFSLLTNKDTLDSHFFYNLDKNVSFKNFTTSKINLKVEKVSNDTYLKGNQINSPIINNYDTLETSVELDMSSDDLDITTNLIIYENLNKQSSDRYEYIFPIVELTKTLKNKTKLNGNFTIRSNNYFQNYQTNIFEKVNINDLEFKSTPKISKKGFYNNYEFIIKNSNTDSKNSKSLKNKEDFYLSGLYQFNSSFPLIKSKNGFNRLIKPKISLKLSPNNMRNISKENNRLDINNIFNLNRISSNNILEGGMSLTYGSDYTITNQDENRDIFSLKLANNLRLEENDDFEKNNQLGSKTSNLFGEIIYSPYNFLTTKYNVSTKNNFYDVNYENLTAEIKLNNFVTTFDYLNENDIEKNSYFLNTTTYNFDEQNNITFSTRENKKTNLTEYYNLMYQYNNDCLAASVEYKKEYYDDRDIKPSESIFLKLTIVPFGTTGTPNLKQ